MICILVLKDLIWVFNSYNKNWLSRKAPTMGSGGWLDVWDVLL